MTLQYISLLYAKLVKKMRGYSISNSYVHDTSVIESGTTIYNSSILRHSFCGYDCTILNCDIGAFCSLASNISIGGVMHPLEFVSTSPVFLSHKDSIKTKFAHHSFLPVHRTIIGNDVWIGEGAFIKAGITIGDGAAVGMGSVVTRDVQPYSIVAGNPARIIRMRFAPSIVQALIKLQWWNLPDDELSKLGHLFDDPMALLRSQNLL